MTLLDIEGLRVSYGRGRNRREVVHGVDLYVRAGETLGLVGESGSGKTTVGRALLGMTPISGGTLQVAGHQVGGRIPKAQRRAMAKDVQVIFQDPYRSLNPALTIGSTLSEPLVAQGVPRRNARARIAELLRKVNLTDDAASRRPYEFSGGQRQRIAIARALALDPKLIVCDEPVSALDLTTQALILDLLMDIQKQTNVGLLFISHDLAVVRHISHRVAVMYRGDIVEQGDTRLVTESPVDDYTKRLLLASPIADPARQRTRRKEWLKVRERQVPTPATAAGTLR